MLVKEWSTLAQMHEYSSVTSPKWCDMNDHIEDIRIMCPSKFSFSEADGTLSYYHPNGPHVVFINVSADMKNQRGKQIMDRIVFRQHL